MHVLITGGLGFIGSHLALALRKRGLRVTAVDNEWFNGVPLTSAQSAVVDERRRQLQDAGVDVLGADLHDTRVTGALLAQIEPSHIAHLAGLSRADIGIRDPLLAVRANVTATACLLTEAARLQGLERVLFVSSSMVYGHFESKIASEDHPRRPIEPYGATKLAAETLMHAWARSQDFEAVVVRPTAVYGTGDFNSRVVQRFVENAIAGIPLELYANGEERLDFTWVEDAAAGIAGALMAPETAGQTLNVSGGDARSLLELSQVVAAYVPDAEIQRNVRRSGRPSRGGLDITRARDLFGYSPQVSLEEGVRRMLAVRGYEVPSSSVPRVKV